MMRSLAEVFPYIRTYKSLGGWGFHIFASMSPLVMPTAEEVISRLPANAKRDMMEAETKMDIKDYINLTLKREVPLSLLMNQEDDSVYISDDHPFNEYFLLRRFRDKRSGVFRLVN